LPQSGSSAVRRKRPGLKAVPPNRRRRPVARAARFENTNKNAAANSRIRPPTQGWPTRGEIIETLRQSTALMVLSVLVDWRLIDLFDDQPLMIVKVRAGAPRPRACERIGELAQAGVTIVLAAQDLDGASRLDEIARQARRYMIGVAGSA
jgi:hypothetical protein